MLLFADGQLRSAVNSDSFGRESFDLADVTGDPALELLIVTDGGKAIRVLDLGGKELRRIDVGHYITHLRAADAPAGGKAEIVVSAYPVERRQGAFLIYDGEGRELNRWSTEPAGHFQVFAEQPELELVMLGEGAFVFYGMEGKVLRRLPAKDAFFFRDVAVLRLPDGRWVGTASGDGYRHYHMICVWSAAGELLYQETGKDYVHGLATLPATPNSFYLGRGSQLWRFTLSAQ